MTTDLPGLIIPVEARVDALERSLKKANRAQGRAAGRMETRAKQSATRIGRSYERMGNSAAAAFSKKLLPALAAIASVQTIRGIADATKQVASLGDAADRAGVSIEALQEWKFVGEKHRIGLDEIVDGLKELNLRADEFILTSAGPAVEAFGRLGYGAEELKRKLENPADLLTEIIGRMEDLDNAARIRIGDEIFGGSAGERFVQLVSTGEAGLRAMRRQAHAAGAVMDSEIIERAQEIDQKFAALEVRASTLFKSMAVGAAELGVGLVETFTGLTAMFDSIEQAQAVLGDGVFDTIKGDNRTIRDMRDEINGLQLEYVKLKAVGRGWAQQAQSDATMLRNLGHAEVASEISAISTRMAELVKDFDDGAIEADEFEQGMADLTSEAQTAFGALSDVAQARFSGPTSSLGILVRALDTAAKAARTLRGLLPGAEADGGTSVPEVPTDSTGEADTPAPSPYAPTTSLRPRLPSVNHSFGEPDPIDDNGGGSGAGPVQSDYELEVASIAEQTAALRLEATAIAEVVGKRHEHGDALEYARTKADLLAAAQRSGVAMTPELSAQIDQLAGEYSRAGYEAETAADRIQQVQDASRAGAQEIGNIFQELASGAMSAEEATRRLVFEIVKLIVQKKLLAAIEASSGGGGGGSAGGGGGGGSGDWAQTALRVGAIIFGGGFASGGYTGDGGKNEPAGVVHRGEFVMSKAATSAIGVGNLEALHESARRGYSGGGLVGGAQAVRGAPAGRTGAGGIGEVTINAPVTVNGSAGTPDQNADLAKRMAAQMESTMRGVVVSELQKQMRPGNTLNNRRNR